MADEIDAMALYRAWQQLDNGACAQIRRVSEPDELRDIPAFYRLVQPFGWENPRHQQALLRMVFCLGNDSNLLIVFYVQIMPDDFVMQLHRF
ncbi:hypothetical protein BK344_24300 [Escherichia coli]|nr:hypothetical protein BK344_24300 [Escherichia coli]OJP61127.1 hypothetical protein BK345_24300 [Escherichia coli]